MSSLEVIGQISFEMALLCVTQSQGSRMWWGQLLPKAHDDSKHSALSGDRITVIQCKRSSDIDHVIFA